VVSPGFAVVFFLYGLAFFSMALAIWVEIGRCSDARLRQALRPLAAFGFLHGFHEWLEMFLDIFAGFGPAGALLLWESLRLGVLAFSFLSLTAFGASLLAPNERMLRVSLMVPIIQAGIWGFGVLLVRDHYPSFPGLWDVVEVWTRYILGAVSALLAAAGLVAQQRAFRQAGMARFGRDSLWAAVAFAWYGIVGQLITRPSALPPSNLINQDVFLATFGFPVQLLRAGAAGVAAIFVIRFLRSFEVGVQREMAELQAARLREARRREELRGQMLGRVVEAQEAERQRIARELHDETGQALTAIGLGLRAVSTWLGRNPAKAHQNLKHLEDLVDRSLNELQRLIADLRPSQLDDLGLLPALRWYINDLKQRVPVDIHLDVQGDQRAIPSTVKIAIFRVAQEALTNVVKHADAEHATVRLSFQDQAVSLEISDDGSGFDLAMLRNPNRPSWGLIGMQERASLLGGDLRIETAVGEGTCVEARFPIPQEMGEQGDEDQAAVGR
jgi:signal transduction histidine kinase